MSTSTRSGLFAAAMRMPQTLGIRRGASPRKLCGPGGRLAASSHSVAWIVATLRSSLSQPGRAKNPPRVLPVTRHAATP